MKNERPRAFAEDSKGDIWIATGSGLARWNGERFRIYYLEDGLSYGSVRTVLQLQHSGDILVGTEGGLNRVHEGEIVKDPALLRFAGEKVWSTYEDDSGGIWVGTTGNGLFRLKNSRVSQFRTGDGLLSNFIYQIVNDRNGRLWFSTPAGIFAIRRSDLDRMADGGAGPVPIIPFGTAEGLESTQMNGGVQTAGCRTSGGELWFPSANGIVRIDPRRLPASNSPPVLIERLLADETPIGAGRQVPAGTRKLEIDFTACDLASPERLRFKYKLDGFDERWTTASGRRAAFYTNLPPRDYRFRVMAMEASETSVAFRWQPFFYQTWWFLGLCILAAGLSLWASLRFFAQQTKARYAVLLAERTRLAREMHDTLIQGCVGVSTLLEAAGTLEDTGTERQLIEQARVQVRSTIDEARQAVWDLRNDSGDEPFAVRLSGWARRMGIEPGIGVEIRVDGKPVRLGADADRNLLLVGREAVRNATSHGHANQVRIDVRFGQESVELKIEDNGSGFELETVRGAESGHYGILGMRERIEMIGGTFTIRSAPGKGTTVAVLLPLMPQHERA